MDVHRSQARVHGTLLHLFPFIDLLQSIVLGLVVLVVGLGVFLVKIVERQAPTWPRRQRDEERIPRLSRYARLLAARRATAFLLQTSKHALHGADPAPSNDLVRGRTLPVVHASEQLQREKT